jgi:hypothetical protein
MTPEQILAWAQAAQILMAAGVATVTSLKAMFAASGMTEDEMDAVLTKLIENAGTRKRRSRAIADGSA